MILKTDDAVLEDFRKVNALKEGHFILTSGLHSPYYVQCALIFANPTIARKLCTMLATKVTEKFGKDFADIIVAPAVGAIVMGYEMGNLLNLESVFCERGSDGKFIFKRDFVSKIEGKRVLIAEVVMTTGKSSVETIECIQNHGGKAVVECIFMNRASNSDIKKLHQYTSIVDLIHLDIPTYTQENLPEELKKIPAVYPGSRQFINVK